MKQHRPRIQRRLKIALLCFTLCFVWFAASCKRANNEQVQVTSPTASVPIPDTEEPIIALVSSIHCWPSPIFVLYGDGRVIFGHEFQYASARFTAEDIRQLYTSMDIDSLREWNGHLFTPSDSFSASYFLLIRDSVSSYLGISLFSLPPYVIQSNNEEWPDERRPPNKLTRVLDVLDHYSIEGAAEWMPTEIEIEFQPAVPSPNDKSWWPKSWPKPKFDPSKMSGRTYFRMESSHAKELLEYRNKYGELRLSGYTHMLRVRYTFPHEEGIVAALKRLPVMNRVLGDQQ